jgi:hypothetical protein
VTDVIQKVAQAFKCKPLEGVLSHQMKRWVIDGNQVIINRPEFDQQVEEFTFQVNEVYGLDVVMSTGTLLSFFSFFFSLFPFLLRTFPQT